MRTREIEVGCTYMVLVPQRLPRSRYPDCDQPGSLSWAWSWLRGGRFRLTVTEIDHTCDPIIVEGLRITANSRIAVVLTTEQAHDLGLPFGVFRVRGTLFDGEDRPVRLPEVEPLRVPARWLRPVEQPCFTHRDIDCFPYL
ncbi:hypothetical protein IU486_25125 [Streptomyces gardneri]|jgi:hypothetical protein|uniref:hypothetical protein n=1 Tax=Nocardia TaxID=1817 RepID=UPI00135CF04F|nr:MULTISPECIES: hypothetical protein [Nocardia]MBF6168007.1 hypothetical protein [Streptomyces gardneri]MBF6206786.1 hypothetical protein [Streptomyces gardneri]UAK32793.1 hypothetical protein K8O92_01860 [Nocardia asteroides]